MAETVSERRPLVLQDQGSFFFGGREITGPDGQVAYVDYGYARFQSPTGARSTPLVMVHGGGQTGKTYETTPDGRDGYEQIFTRRGFSVYLVDIAGRGRGGRSEQGTTIPDATPGGAFVWELFRLGNWQPPAERSFFPGVQFPKADKAVDQYYQQATVTFGAAAGGDEASRELNATNLVALLTKIGPSVLICHSQSGQYCWRTAARRPDLVKAVVAYEPEPSFAFRSDQPPADVRTDDPFSRSQSVPQLFTPGEIRSLASLPITVIYGDNIPTKPTTNSAFEFWRVGKVRARQFAKTIERAGGTVDVVSLPDLGINGNTHFAFSDLNNVRVADQLAGWLKKNSLD